MPELGWRYGYVYGLALMVASVAAPFLYFRRKGWLG
jgi:magnesium transporter